MATELETLTATLASLKKSRNTGTLRVDRGENRTWFRSLAEMDAIIADLEGQIAAINGTPQRVKRIYLNGGKGL